MIQIGLEPLPKRITFTGHRPSKLGGFEPTARIKLHNFAKLVVQELKPKAVISGMALGWDTAIATAATEQGVELIAAVPFWGRNANGAYGISTSIIDC